VAGLKEGAAQLRAAEEPLWAAYKELQGAAQGRVASALCEALLEAQKRQLAYLRFLEEELPSDFIAVGSVTSHRVKLRSGPGGSHPVLDELDAGVPVIVTAWSGYWAAVQVPGGRQGYVFRDYVRTEGDGPRSSWSGAD